MDEGQAGLPLMEIRFRHLDGGWEVIVSPQEEPRRVQTWREPDRLLDLFFTLFDEGDAPPSRSLALLQRPWRLRLMRQDAAAGLGELPGLPSWCWLRHPSGAHLLDLGWTVATVPFWPRPGATSGRVAVIGDEVLRQALARELGPRVVAADAASLPQRSLVVVTGRLADREAQDVQRAAAQAGCPLIIWCATWPPRSELVEVVPADPPQEPPARWLVRFLSRVLANIDPEVAFAQAGLDGPPQDRGSRWLRGAFESWQVDPSERTLDVPRDWFIRLDRSKQDSLCDLLVNNLVLPRARRRIQVVITPGPAGAGLELFRRRTPRIGGIIGGIDEVPRIPLVPWDLGWADDPRYQEQLWLWRLQASGRAELPERLVAEAVRHRQRLGGSGERVLFWVRHETLAVQRTPGLREVTLPELKHYLEFLRWLAGALAPHEVRLLLHLSVQGATQEQLRPLQIEDDKGLRCDVLPTLSGGVPPDELRQWLSIAGLGYTEEDLNEMVSRDYEGLIDLLYSKYPELRAV